MRSRTMLFWAMLLSGGLSACNLLLLPLLPILIPGANFTILQLAFFALAGRKYGVFLIGGALAFGILAGSVSIRRSRVGLPALCAAVYLGDGINAAYRFAADLPSGDFHWFALCSVLVDILLLALLAQYFTRRFRASKA